MTPSESVPADIPVVQVELTAADGLVIRGQIFGRSRSGQACVLIAGALGIDQRFYAPFARWLAGRGHQVMTFDLRGMGASRPPQHRRSLRGLDADMLTWARLDFPAAVNAMFERAARLPICLLGHSLGAHHAAMTDAQTQARIERVVAVGAGAGYWRDWAPASRRLAPLMLHVAAPILTPLFGYFPGKALGMVGDLPAPAIRQWTRWCRHPDFAWGAEPDAVLPSLRAAQFRIDAFSFTDDEAMTTACVQKLLAALPNAPSTLHVVRPNDVGMKRIGHIGAFRAQGALRLWPMLEQACVARAVGEAS